MKTTGKFTKGTNPGTFTCTLCGERRQKGSTDSNDGLCGPCFDEAGTLNSHADGYHADAPASDCPDCTGAPERGSDEWKAARLRTNVAKARTSKRSEALANADAEFAPVETSEDRAKLVADAYDAARALTPVDDAAGASDPDTRFDHAYADGIRAAKARKEAADKPDKLMPMRVSISLTVNVDAWRREYGTAESDADIRGAIQQAVLDSMLLPGGVCADPDSIISKAFIRPA